MNVTMYQTNNAGEFVKTPLFPSVPMSGAKTLTDSGEVIAEDFLGFGVAITGSSCYELASMPPRARRALLTDLYTKEGVGLSVGRLTIGSSDYSAELYSYDDVPDDVNLAHFSIDRDRAYIIPMIKEILEINPELYLFASPWSPPGWMKTGGSLCGGYMREEYLEVYANYIVRYLQEYEKCGIHISALTPQNEPETQQSSKMPSCIWHPDLEAKFILILRDKLNEAGLRTQIWMYDHNFVGTDRIKWCLETYPRLTEACNGFAFHYYRGGIEQTDGLRAAYPALRPHFTEGGPRVTDNYDTDWCKWGMMMAQTLNHGFGSFTGWNLMLDEFGRPNVGPFLCGGLVTLNSVSGELSYSGQYKAFRHFAHFMKPGVKLCRAELPDVAIEMCYFPKSALPMETALFRNPDGSRYFVLVNRDTSKRQVQLALDGQMWYAEILPNTLATIAVEE